MTSTLKAQGLITSFIILCVNLSTAQCVNPTPVGSALQEFCARDELQISDLEVGGELVKWYAEPDGGTPLDVSELLGSGFYYADDVASGNCSVGRLEVEVVVSGYPPKNVNISQIVCESDGFRIKNLSVSGENVEWYSSEIGGELLPKETLLVDRAIYWVQQIENGCVSVRVPTLVIFEDVPRAIFSDDNLNQEFCEVTNPKVSDLNVEGMDINWYATATATVKLNGDVLLRDGEDYWAANTLLFGCESDTRTQITVSVDKKPNAGGNHVLVVCTSSLRQPPINLFDFLEGVPEKGGVWIGPSNVTGGDLGVYTFGDNISGEYTYTVKSSLGICEESTATVIIKEVSADVPTTTSVLQEFCKSDSAVVGDLQVLGTLINWYSSATSTTVLDKSAPLEDRASYYASQTSLVTGCESEDRLMVKVQINDSNAPTTVNMVQEFCESDIPLVSDLEANGVAIKWYASPTATTVLEPTTTLINGASYYATQTYTDKGCESTERLKVTAAFIKVPTPELVADGQQFCVFDNPTVADLSLNVRLATSTEVYWYDAYPNGQLISETEALISTQTYYGIAIDAKGCGSEPLIIMVSLDVCTLDDIVIYDGFSPNGDGVNDTFPIENIDLVFPNYTIVFYNRWGNLVYSGDRNNPDWNGRLNGNGKALPVGIYYYVLNLNDTKKRQKQGRLFLTR